MVKNNIKAPLVSIIVPFYNSERTLEKCLTSIEQQEYENIEIVLVNDGSKDKGLEIAKNYAQKYKNIKIFSQKNLGVAVAKERGVECSTGDYITFVDSDDYILPTYISDYIAAICKYDCDICISGYSTLKNGNLKKHLLSNRSFSIQKAEAMSDLLKDGFGDFFCNKIFSRKVMRYFKLDSGKNYEDIRECYKLFQYANTFFYVSNPGYVYVIHSGSITSTPSKKNRYDLYEAKIGQYLFFKENGYNDAIKVAYPSLIEVASKYLLFCGKLRNRSYDNMAKKIIYEAKLQDISSYKLKVLVILIKIWEGRKW
ncbi:glycosyltransferase family 2 protein [Lactobacillus sp. PV012]|uniref:glycosyltransferase family 2 protein n=1 Tax=Lactobacillus sp. PV012 TaxID=2594494 RepID=UPI002240BBF5|nr:glycosyltransferase [Lactobacillus sp. PV012]QNQ82770.1 glycosyltransferase [Lactobacillus sp. PV012]